MVEQSKLVITESVVKIYNSTETSLPGPACSNQQRSGSALGKKNRINLDGVEDTIFLINELLEVGNPGASPLPRWRFLMDEKQFIVRTSRRYREMLTLRGGDHVKCLLYYSCFKVLVAYIHIYTRDNYRREECCIVACKALNPLEILLILNCKITPLFKRFQ